MTPAGTESEILRFGVFELDRKRAELRKNGLAVKLAPQPFKVLDILAARPGELISRDDLRHEVWGDETFVDFDRSLNVCMTQIRSALNDSAESPRFIQTVPRRGYRFLAPVEGSAPAVAARVDPEKPPGRDIRPWVLLAVFVAVAILVTSLWRLAEIRDERTRLAILPFSTIGDAQVSDAAIEGLTDDLITQA
ncbi:MAG: winged helix-turn-helix domain-containing protein, partial [Bryobacteraceae bacterium]